MIRLLCATALVALVQASMYDPCCTPGQYEVAMFEIGSLVRGRNGGRLTPRQEWLEYTYDYPNKREAHSFSFYHQDGSEFRGRSLLDFKTNSHYVLTHDDQNCTVYALNRNMPSPCIPKNATFIASRYLGDGNDKLQVFSWQYDILGTDHIFTKDVSPNGCIPIVASRSGTRNGSVETVAFTYYNFKQGISDSRVFQIPMDCPAQRLDRPVGRSLEILEKLERYQNHIH